MISPRKHSKYQPKVANVILVIPKSNDSSENNGLPCHKSKIAYRKCGLTRSSGRNMQPIYSTMPILTSTQEPRDAIVHFVFLGRAPHVIHGSRNHRKKYRRLYFTHHKSLANVDGLQQSRDWHYSSAFVNGAMHFYATTRL